MDFAIFSKTEVKEMFQTMLEHMPDNMKEYFSYICNNTFYR